MPSLVFKEKIQILQDNCIKNNVDWILPKNENENFTEWSSEIGRFELISFRSYSSFNETVCCYYRSKTDKPNIIYSDHYNGDDFNNEIFKKYKEIISS